MRAAASFVAAGLLLSACVSDNTIPQAIKPLPSASELADVKVPGVEDLLTAKQMGPCLYRKHVKPDQNAIVSQGLGFWLAAQVENSRDLNFDLSIDDVELLNEAEFRKAIPHRSAGEIRARERVLKWLAWGLGMAPHGLDVNNFVSGEESNLIAGFYDPKSNEIVVQSGERISGSAVVTLAHEMAHLATDQSFGFPKLKSDALFDDKRLARRSLIEGDASLVEMRFVSRFVRKKPVTKALKKQLALQDRFDRDRRNGVPQLLIDEFIFPYQWGLSFICAVYKKEGWKGVNRMYRRPPSSSAEIMFPERWLTGDKPSRPAPLGKLTKPWKLHSEGALGAAHLKALFEAPLNLAKNALGRPVARAASWDGGRYSLWVADDQPIGSVGVALVEHPKYPGVLCDSMRRWYEATFFNAEPHQLDEETVSYRDENQIAAIECSDKDVRIGIGPDIETVQALIGQATTDG